MCLISEELIYVVHVKTLGKYMLTFKTFKLVYIVSFEVFYQITSLHYQLYYYTGYIL